MNPNNIPSVFRALLDILYILLIPMLFCRKLMNSNKLKNDMNNTIFLTIHAVLL